MLCFSPVAYHVTFYYVVETPTFPQVVSNSLVVYNNFSILYVLRVSAIISDLNFEAHYVRAQRKNFTKMWMKAFVLLEVVFLCVYKVNGRDNCKVTSTEEATIFGCEIFA